MSFLRFFRLSPRSNRTYEFTLPVDTDPYSTEETATLSTWLDGRTIYRKVLPFAHGPNSIQLSIVHDIVGLDLFTSVRGFMQGPNKQLIPLPYVGDNLDFNPNTCVNLQADDTNAYITPIDGAGQDWSAYAGNVILEYVKVP